MSKGLKDFDTIKWAILTTQLKLPYYTLSENEYNKKVLERKKEIIDNLEKELKALEIIKKKLVDIISLITSCNLFSYNYGKPNNLQLTQEEYGLLKEVLNDE